METVTRRRPSLFVRCLQGVATPLLLAVTVVVVYGVGAWIAGRW